MGVSTARANAILDDLFNNGGGDIYISLHTGDPGTTGANEVTGGSYARQQVPFNAAASKSAVNTSAINFTLMPTATVTHIGVWDASSGGNFECGGALSTSITKSAGQTLTLTAEHITASVA